jgi:hypothetical protein
MKIKELIEILSKFDGDLNIEISDPDTIDSYGCIDIYPDTIEYTDGDSTVYISL